MLFTFFSPDDTPVFVRGDAESATWTVQEMSLTATFPYLSDKVISRGQRIGFIDYDGDWQIFEVRKCRTYHPDEYQEITAEHIIISELTDVHIEDVELTDMSASVAVTQVISNAVLWNLASAEVNPTSSGDVTRGSVWQALNTIMANWNVRIVPVLTVTQTGITRALAIKSREGTFRGMRLSLESNADEMGVTWDDTELCTALYGYGANDENGDPIKFTNEDWPPAWDHPGHEAGYDYLEDPAATALYGRNGEPRFGYYQNSDITSPAILLQKTWETLKTINAPRLTIDCTLSDLQRLGYTNTPVRLGDKVVVEVRPTGEIFTRDIIGLMVDLLDPTATRPTIGAYIPNIVYIERDTAREATGYSGGGGGTGNAHGQTKQQSQMTEYHTEIQANSYQISLRATKTDLDTAVNTLDASITVEAGRITQIVQAVGDNGQVTAASIVLAVNSAGSSVMINADKIILDGETIAAQLAATNAKIANLISGQTIANQLWANYLNVVQNCDINSAIIADGYVNRLYVEKFTSDGQPVYQAAQWRTVTISGTTITYLG